MKTVLLATGWLCLLLSHSLLGQTILRGPYLQAPTTQSITLRWRSDVMHTGKVWYGLSPNNLTQSTTALQPANDHEVTIVNLLPDTKYYYAVGNATGDVVLAGNDSNHYFSTFPNPGTLNRIDSGPLAILAKAMPYRHRLEMHSFSIIQAEP
jgi:hypothetical protein